MSGRTHGPRVLIANDDPASLALTVQQLTARGCTQVSTVSDGLQAIRMIRAERPEVVVASVTLPGLDGFQLCRLLHSPVFRNGTAPVPVVLTATGHQDLVAGEIARIVQAEACVHPTNDPDALYEFLVASVDSVSSAGRLELPLLGRALLISSDAECHATLEQIFSGRGWGLKRTESLIAAVRIIQRHECDLVLFDADDSSTEAENAIRELSANGSISVVALTKRASEEGILRLMQAGAHDYLLQPFDPGAVDLVCLNALNRNSYHRIYRLFEEKIEELRAMGDYLDMVIRFSQEAIFSCDPVGRVRIWNKGAERMYGYTADEIMGGIVDDYLDPPDFTRKSPDVVRILQQREWSFVEPEIFRRKKNGEIFAVHATYSAIISDDGECIGFSVIERDVGTHKALEAEKIKSARLRAITQTAVTANDQINTPLGVILGYAQFLQRKMTNLAPEDAAALEIIQQQVLKIKGIMNKLKLMSDPIVKNYSIEGVTMLDLTQSK